MRPKKVKLSAVLLLGLGLSSIQAQTMYVKKSNGTQTAYPLNSIRKMTFSGVLKPVNLKLWGLLILVMKN